MVLRPGSVQTVFPELETLSPVIQLERDLGADWRSLKTAAEETQTVLFELDQLVSGKASADSSVVVTGSLGRKEYTKGSDLDWILLVDGAGDAAISKRFWRLTVQSTPLSASRSPEEKELSANWHSVNR